MNDFPASFEEALWAAAREQLPPDVFDPRALAAAITARSHRYTDERERLGARLPSNDRGRDLAARALFFTVADAAKIGVPIAELAGRGLLPDAEPLRVLDIGAGCGAMSLGLAAVLEGRPLEITAVDQDRQALDLFARAAQLLPEPLAIRTLAGDASGALSDAQFDLVLAGTVLNEISPDLRLRHVERWLRAVAPGGALIIIEPALRETARDLHAIRDAILTAKTAHVFAPCTRAAAPCPALADPDDWCHEDRPTTLPPRLRALVQRTGLRAHGLKFAYLTLRHRAEPQVVAPPGRRALRVVSDALDQKGTTERMVCGDNGRSRMRLLNRNRDANNRAFGRSKRGDVLLVGPDEKVDLA